MSRGELFALIRGEFHNIHDYLSLSEYPPNHSLIEVGGGGGGEFYFDDRDTGTQWDHIEAYQCQSRWEERCTTTRIYFKDFYGRPSDGLHDGNFYAVLPGGYLKGSKFTSYIPISKGSGTYYIGKDSDGHINLYDASGANILQKLMTGYPASSTNSLVITNRYAWGDYRYHFLGFTLIGGGGGGGLGGFDNPRRRYEGAGGGGGGVVFGVLCLDWLKPGSDYFKIVVGKGGDGATELYSSGDNGSDSSIYVVRNSSTPVRYALAKGGIGGGYGHTGGAGGWGYLIQSDNIIHSFMTDLGRPTTTANVTGSHDTLDLVIHFGQSGSGGNGSTGKTDKPYAAGGDASRTVYFADSVSSSRMTCSKSGGDADSHGYAGGGGATYFGAGGLAGGATSNQMYGMGGVLGSGGGGGKCEPVEERWYWGGDGGDGHLYIYGIHTT